MDGIVDGERADRSRECGAVENTKVFLGCQRDRFEMVGGERLARRDDPATTESRRAVENADRRITDEGAGNIRQRGEICSQSVSELG